ncbi:MAG: hypothetical protein JXQ74_00570 [Alphaproteobacteria bacterium]|nr:hypothetical protein [Alphaproteobacteria bacterium]
MRTFFQKEIRTQQGLAFFIALLLCFYFFIQLMFGRANVWRYIRLSMQVQEEKQVLTNLEKDLKELHHKIGLIENKDKDYIDELLRKKLNKFPPNTYQIKENNE